ncbi:2'-5' RNA ligase family protein [Gryllotalpicola reticulitermitis]|uniref:2'-5' RNA ligase family protein n=1 Tax=Gryllotalpicola reticulitermitis TaxID=1184153 RepID=A0ABV8Q4W6_9MICO
MPSLVEALLAGPRGRRLCLEFAQRDEGAAGVAELRRLLFWAGRRLGPRNGAAVSAFQGRAAEGEPDPSIADIGEALAAVPLPVVDDVGLMHALAESVVWARYWQGADETDLVLERAELLPALGRVAKHIADSPATRWWTAPSGREQWRVAFHETDGRAVPAPIEPAQVLSSWAAAFADERDRAARERPSDVTANFSGAWWSTPPRRLLASTRRVADLAPVGLGAVEDDLGWTAAAVSRGEIAGSPRIYEISDADAWAALCARYPLDATAARRHDWYRATGRDGAWVIPDWPRVARDYDAVHLTVAAYLEAAGRALPVRSGAATVIAGWTPDQTYWLRDAPHAAGTSQWWVRDADTADWFELRGTGRFVVVGLFAPLRAGDSISRKAWPAHVTLASNFRVTASVSDVVAAMLTACADSGPLDLHFAGTAMFGPDHDVPVRLVESDAVRALHHRLADRLEPMGGFVRDEPAYWRAGYRPHLTLGPGVLRRGHRDRRLTSVALAELDGSTATVAATVDLPAGAP